MFSLFGELIDAGNERLELDLGDCGGSCCVHKAIQGRAWLK